MNKVRERYWLLLLLLAIVPACARVPVEAGFGDVRQLVAARAEYRLHWSRDSAEDTEVRQAIQRLLGEELTVDGAVRIALLNNRGLQAIYEQLGITQADVVEAGLLKNPVFFGQARFPNKPPLGTNLEFNVVQDFLNLLMLPVRKKLAEAQFEETKLRVANDVLNLAARVQKAYYEATGAKQVAEMRRLIAQAGQSSYEMAQRMYQAGNISDLNLANQRGLYEQTRMALARSETNVVTLREQLTDLMGLWGSQADYKIPSRLPDLPKDEMDFEHLESLAIANRLDLAAARQEVRVLAQNLGISRKWRWIGSVEAGVSSERDTDGQWITGPTLSLELPVFDQDQAKISRNEALLRQSQARLTALAVGIRSEIRSIRNRLLTTRNLVEHYKNVIIPLRERIVVLTQQEYSYMLAGVFVLLLAKQQEYDAYQEYIETVEQYWTTRSELQRAVGGRLPALSSKGS
jgi:cobalt-zinc-cadmium efflux system outer membrane protein